VQINTFKDQDNQEAIDYFLGRIEEFTDDDTVRSQRAMNGHFVWGFFFFLANLWDLQLDTGASWLKQQMMSREAEFATASEHHVYVGTFNCNDKTPVAVNIDDWLNPLRVLELDVAI